MCVPNPKRATCALQGVDPYTYLVDVLQRVGRHPASRDVELTPRVWRPLFAEDPLRSDLDRARDSPEASRRQNLDLLQAAAAAAPLEQRNALRPSLAAYCEMSNTL